MLFALEILDILVREFGPIDPAPCQDLQAPAADYEYRDGGGRIGMIASVSRPFCRACSRIRMTAEGKLSNCLFALDETDLHGLLRGDADDAAIALAIRDCVIGKWEGHEINTSRFIKFERLMHSIGG